MLALQAFILCTAHVVSGPSTSAVAADDPSARPTVASPAVVEDGGSGPPASTDAAGGNAAGDAPEESAALAVDEGGETDVAAETEDEPDEGSQTIVSRRRDLRRVAGSANTVDKETLERFEPDDVLRALRAVPGVYVRDEDGQGLRPNIGLRGASSDRSAKVALLEDGVLFAPAPYAAPAAYYFPLMTRIVDIEVFKGPASIRQGPHTVGGAINLRTRPTPYEPGASLDAGFGLVGPGREQVRLHGFAGAGDETWGVLIEGARVQSDGFRRIDGHRDANTGFLRDDVMLKARVGNGLVEEVRHALELKVGIQREESNETYLGLSDADFRADPERRYHSSLLDRMSWFRTQGQLRYALHVGDDFDVDVVAYRHDLERSWRKVNGLRAAPNLHEVLTYADVGASAIFASQLRGGAGSTDDGVAVLVGPNQRSYYAQGIAAVTRGRFLLGSVEQKIEAGARLHQDGILRRHSERGFQVQGNAMVDLGEDDVIIADNSATATALALHVADEVRFLDFTLVPGARLELIGGTFADAGGPAVESFQAALLPGVGAAWQPWPFLVVLAGVHRGFSPVAPGQAQNAQPEFSTNVEAGVRLDLRERTGLSGEVIGFHSAYENILAECTFSAGCVNDIGAQQNGGAASIAGAELVLRHELPLSFSESSRIRSEAS